MVGNNSGVSLTDGSANTFVGEFSGATVTDGDNNVFIGRSAGFNIPTNTIESTFIGAQSGAFNTGNNCVFVGYRAGIANTDDNKLIIGNSSSSELIKGDFSAENVELNGDVSLGKSDNSSVVNFNRSIIGSAGASAGYIDIEVAGVSYKLQIYSP